jgi:hypothetical protein
VRRRGRPRGGRHRRSDTLGERQDKLERTDNPVATTGDPTDRLLNLAGRRVFWEAALDAFKTEPAHGIGAGTYEYFWNRAPQRDTPVRDAHSLYLESLAELGVPGALLVVLAMGSLLVAAVRSPFRLSDPPPRGPPRDAPWRRGLLRHGRVDWLWEVTAVASLGLVCGGLAAVAGGRGDEARPRLVSRLAMTLLAMVLLAVQAPVLISASQVQASRESIGARRVQEALSHATTAIDAQPWRRAATCRGRWCSSAPGRCGPPRWTRSGRPGANRPTGSSG